MLKGEIGFMLTVSREMNLAILSHDLASLVDEYRGVEPSGRIVVADEFSITEIKSNSSTSGSVEQWFGVCVGHVCFKKRIDIGLILEIPAWKECRQCQFWNTTSFDPASSALRSRVIMRFTADARGSSRAIGPS
jgi:hypothetical protein